MCWGVCARMHACLCAARSALCFNFLAETAGWGLRLETAFCPVPFTCSCQRNPLPLHSSALGSLQSVVPRAAAPSPPASVASSLLQELAWILLYCPRALSQQSNVGMSCREWEAREEEGNVGKHEWQQCLLAPGAVAEAWAPLLPLVPACACHQWKFPLGLPVPGLVSTFPGTTLHPGTGGCCCSR